MGYGMVVDGIAKFQALKFIFQGLRFPVKSLVLLVRRRFPQKFQALKFHNSGPEMWRSCFCFMVYSLHVSRRPISLGAETRLPVFPFRRMRACRADIDLRYASWWNVANPSTAIPYPTFCLPNIREKLKGDNQRAKSFHNFCTFS